MAAGKFNQPDYTTDTDSSAYPLKIDSSLAAAERFASWFNPHEQDVGSPQPDMTVRVQAGFIYDGRTTLSAVAAQTVSGFTTPSAGQHRIDRVVINKRTGVASRVAGTAVTGSPSAVAPDVPAGNMPCCQVAFTDASTSISNSMITPERVFPEMGSAEVMLASGTVTAGAALDLVLTAYTGFKRLVLEIEDLVPATDDVEQHAASSTDGGSSFDSGAGNYEYSYFALHGATALSSGSTGDTKIRLGATGAARGNGNASGESGSLRLVFHTRDDATYNKRLSGDGCYMDANNDVGCEVYAGVRMATADVDAWRLIMESGNMSCKWRLSGRFY